MADLTPAWLLHVGVGMQVAVAENEIVEYLQTPQPHQVPITPPHCSSVVFWRERILPLFNLMVLTQPQFEAVTDYLAVLTYQIAPKTPLRHVGLSLYASPQRILVSDEDASDWPDGFPAIWKPLTSAIFNHKGIQTPVLDIGALCAGSAAL